MTDTEAIAPEELSARPTGSDYTSDREFADFPISEATLQGITQKLGFATATPVQATTIDPALAGRDLIVRAKTGTGKTAAFLVPMIERTPDGARKPTALVLEPTRELAQQTTEQARAIATYRDLRVVPLIGGVAIGPQEDALAQGAEFIVGTPGRILDLHHRGLLDLSAIQTICLDEADEMLSMGFFEDVNRIINATPQGRQILLFSATISPDTRHLVERHLHDPQEIMLSTDADGVALIEHVLYETAPDLHKARALLYLIDLENPSSAIIFCNTREDTATVASFLDRQGLDVELISGELSQAKRTAVMARVQAGETRFLVATDVASRGIDISDLSHVINYALPTDPDVYLHRTGRTGRIGKKGKAISLVGGTDLQTRRVLEGQKGIQFTLAELPDAEAAVRLRIERQAAQIRAALGGLVFESYLPTARALRERPDGDQLIAAALRAFFTWDRERRSRANGTLSTIEAVIEARDAKAERRDRKQRSSEPGKRKGRNERPERAEHSRPKLKVADLDALLELDDGADPLLISEPAAEPTETAKPAKRKKTRTKREPKADTQSSDETPAAAAPAKPDLGDLDALLALD